MEIASFGETMIRLAPPVGFALEGVQNLEVSIGGTESNMCIAYARLGGQCGWTSRMPDNAMARHVAGAIAVHGVDVSNIIWAPGEKLGILFVESGLSPRQTEVIYDRTGTAISLLQPDELDYEYLLSAETLFLTGITPALSESCRQAWLRAAKLAQERKRMVALDVNYRGKLWTPQQCRETIEAVLPHVDVLICGRTDGRIVFDMPPDGEAAAKALMERYKVPLVVMTLGEEGSLAYDGKHVEQFPVYPTEIIDRIGAGDAFDAGFLYGWRQKDIAYGLRCGNAAAALKQTFRGDVTWYTRAQVLDLVDNPARDPRRVQR